MIKPSTNGNSISPYQRWAIGEIKKEVDEEMVKINNECTNNVTATLTNVEYTDVQHNITKINGTITNPTHQCPNCGLDMRIAGHYDREATTWDGKPKPIQLLCHGCNKMILPRRLGESDNDKETQNDTPT